MGDIHGRLDLLEAAVTAIRADAKGGLATVIFLGDYIDRGPDSRGVVEFMMRVTAAPDSPFICLRGNHEQMLVDAYHSRRSDMILRWMSYGGGETLVSYGGSGRPNPSIVPAEHIAWMEQLPNFATDDHRVYVHAGLNPGTPLDAQDEAACMGIRERFLRAEPDELPGHVVHGHTPTWADKPDAAEPELLSHRTNLDTGAYETGVLSVGVFDPDAPGGPLKVMRITVANAPAPQAQTQDVGRS